jgi:hypothetical protein
MKDIGKIILCLILLSNYAFAYKIFGLGATWSLVPEDGLAFRSWILSLSGRYNFNNSLATEAKITYQEVGKSYYHLVDSIVQDYKTLHSFVLYNCIELQTQFIYRPHYLLYFGIGGTISYIRGRGGLQDLTASKYWFENKEMLPIKDTVLVMYRRGSNISLKYSCDATFKLKDNLVAIGIPIVLGVELPVFSRAPIILEVSYTLFFTKEKELSNKQAVLKFGSPTKVLFNFGVLTYLF